MTVPKLSIEGKTVFFLLLITSFLRLWNIPNTLQFLGDQGRDAMVVARIFTKLDPVFIGPVTSVGNMYLGPLYYYFMMPFLFLTYPSPLGPAYAVSFLGIATVWLVYYLGKQLTNPRAATFAVFLLTFSATASLYSRFSWNPNPAPFISILMIFFTYRAWKKSVWYWIGVAACFSVLIQLHYLTLLSAGGAGTIWLLQLIEILKKKTKTDLKSFFVVTLLSTLLFLTSLTPLMLFDSQHGWLNAKAFQALLLGNTGSSIAPEGQSLWRVIRETHGRSMHILFEWLVGQQRLLNSLLVLMTFGLISWVYKTQKKLQPGITVIMAYLVTGIIGTAFYQHTVFDHYIAYLFPIVVLILGITLDALLRFKKGFVLVTAFLIWFSWFNISRQPLTDLGWTIHGMQRTSNSIYQRVDLNEKYNIVLMSETGDIDGQNYRYFLTTTDKPPVPTEERGSVETLFIIDEEKELEDVAASPIYEIVVFPNKNPSEVYTIEGGPRITVLTTRESSNE